MINVLFVTASITGGGAERVLINILNSLDSSLYRLRLVNTGFGSRPKELNHDVEYVELKFNKTFISLLKLKKEINSFNPNYVFTTSFNLGYVLILLKIFMKKSLKVIIRVAVTPSEFPKSGLKIKIIHQLIRHTYNKAYTIIAQTNFMKSDLMSFYNIEGHKIKVIPNLIDKKFLEKQGEAYFPDEFDSKCFNIVASGALYSVKGFDLLISAIASLQTVIHIDLKLFILGNERYEIGYKKKLQNQIVKSDLQDKVFLLGHKDNPYPYYKNADLFVLSSRKEGFPNVILENLYFNIPVVASSCVDFSGVIENGVNGVVVEKESAESLMRGIKYVIESIQKPVNSEIKMFDYSKLFI